MRENNSEEMKKIFKALALWKIILLAHVTPEPNEIIKKIEEIYKKHGY